MSFDADNLGGKASVRLQKLSHVPATSDLEAALNQSKKTTSCVIELPWKAASSPATYVLRVSSEQGVEEANWVLNKGDTQDAAVIWSFESNDVSLIESLIGAEVGNALDLGISDQPVNLDETEKLSQKKEEEKARALSPDLPEGVTINPETLRQAAEQLIYPVSGLVKEEFFLYFLIREFERFKLSGQPLALIMTRIRVDYGDGKVGFLPDRAQLEANRRFSQAIRSIDILAQYQLNKIALILPGSTVDGGVECVKSLEGALSGEPLQPGLDQSQLRISCGIAAIPDTCDTPQVLIACAMQALKQSAEGQRSLVVFPSTR